MYPISIGAINYSSSEFPLYSQKVKEELHPLSENQELQKEGNEEKEENESEVSNEVPIFTYLLKNPVPSRFTQKSIELLRLISTTTNDELYHSKVI